MQVFISAVNAVLDVVILIMLILIHYKCVRRIASLTADMETLWDAVFQSGETEEADSERPE